MEIKGKRMYRMLEKLDFIRLSATDGEKEGARIIFDEVASIGITPHYESFKVPYYEIQKVQFEVTEPKHAEYEVTGYGFSGNNAKDGIEAGFRYVEAAEDIDLVDTKGKIVLISNLSYEIYERLCKAEVAGFIAPSGDFADDLKRTDLDQRMLRQKHTEHGQIPGVCMHMSDVIRLVKSDPKKVKITLSQIETEGESQNVVAEIEGTKYPQEEIVYTGHYDSVVFSHGMYDNAAGSVIMLELARYYVANPPLRTVRFIWTGSEERGLFGSKAYVKDHEADLKKIMLCINIDLVGPVLGRDTAIVLAEEKLCHMIEYMYKEIGHPMNTKFDIYSSDCIPFADKGVPAVNFVRYGTPGAASCHNRNDVLSTLSAKSLEYTTTFIVEFSRRIVNAYIFPVAREIPEDIVKKIDKYLMKK
ncbi:MAG: M28 family metallopeptidase [Clostridia bacterium]